MKRILFTIIITFASLFANAQSPNPTIQGFINQTNLDSLVKYVNELSGEIPVVVNGNTVTILNRIENSNDIAAEYLAEKLESFGLTTTSQEYSTNGTNVFAEQLGTTFPDEKFIICAHYDGVTNYCADDNASGCAGVLEAARLLSQQEFPYTIVYAFWDQEEIGLVGSDYYATQAANNGDVINGVINLEMFGWDSNDDGLYDIHTDNVANSVELAQLVEDITSIYELDLIPATYNPGTGASDHSSFWDNGYGAVVFSEAFYGGDYNPYYHTPNDRISQFNLPYFHELSKLSVGTIATLAIGEELPAPVASFSPEDAATNVAVNQAITVAFNTPIRNLDDTEITNPSEIVEFRKNGANGEAIAFTATINSTKTEITIASDEDMDYNQLYYVAISDQIENADDIQFEGASITFTTLDNSGIISLETEDVKVYPNPSENYVNIEIPIALSFLEVEVLYLSGGLIYSNVYSESNAIQLDISNLSKGMYLMNLKAEGFTITKKISKY